MLDYNSGTKKWKQKEKHKDFAGTAVRAQEQEQIVFCSTPLDVKTCRVSFYTGVGGFATNRCRENTWNFSRILKVNRLSENMCTKSNWWCFCAEKSNEWKKTKNADFFTLQQILFHLVSKILFLLLMNFIKTICYHVISRHKLNLFRTSEAKQSITQILQVNRH